MLLFHGNLWWAASPFPGNPHFHAPALASSVQLYGPAKILHCALWSCISLVFCTRAFFGLCCILGYSATRIFRSKLKGKGKNFMTKHQPSWLASASPFFLLSLLPLSLSLSLSVCHLCLVYSIQKCLRCCRCCLRLSGQFFRVSELWGFIVIYCAIWFCHLRTPLAWGTLLQPVVLHSNNYNVAWRLCHFSWVCQPSLSSENCPVGSPSEILLLKLQGFCICSSGHKEHIASNALVLHAKRCLQAVLEKAVGSVAKDALWFVPCYFMRSRSSISK